MAKDPGASFGIFSPFLACCCIKRRAANSTPCSPPQLPKSSEEGNIIQDEDQGYGTIKTTDDLSSVDDPEPTWNDLADKYSVSHDADHNDHDGISSSSEEEEEEPQYSKSISRTPPVKEPDENMILEVNRSESAASSAPSHVEIEGIVGLKNMKLSEIAEIKPKDTQRNKNTVRDNYHSEKVDNVEKLDRRKGVVDNTIVSESIKGEESVKEEQKETEPVRKVSFPEKLPNKMNAESPPTVQNGAPKIQITEPPRNVSPPPTPPRPSVKTPPREVFRKPTQDTRAKRESTIARAISMSNEELSKQTAFQESGVSLKSKKSSKLFGGLTSKSKSKSTNTLVASDGDGKNLPLNNLSAQYQQNSASMISLTSTQKKKKLKFFRKFGKKKKKHELGDSISLTSSMPSISMASEPPNYYPGKNKYSAVNLLASLDNLSDEDICRD